MATYSHNLILLTGAGFTKNFNGFTSREMWLKIFNDVAIQQSPTLASLVHHDFDFENMYSKVLNGSYSDEDKATIRRVVERVYKKLDDATRNWACSSPNQTDFNTDELANFFSRFKGKDQRSGFFFTLNQDLLMERKYGYCSLATQRFPSGGGLEQQPFSDQWWITLPSDEPKRKIEAALKAQGGLHYVKLHGSYGWRSSDGSSQMVIGKDKADTIQREPLLRQYLNLFQNVIAEGNKRLLVIGYGFGDIHINKILCDGVQAHGLKLIIVTTTTPDQFRQNLMKEHYYAVGIWDGVIAYFQNTLRDLFPPDENGSMHLEDLTRTLLQEQ